jgi:Tfp pilus assembly protein PilV
MRCPNRYHRLPRRPRPGTRAARAGGTLVEVALAVTILGVGVLALVGTAGVTARASDEAWRLSAAAGAARDRFERLTLGGCAAAATADSSVTPAVSVRWRVDGTGWRRSLVVVATVATRTGPRTFALTGSVTCGA